MKAKRRNQKVATTATARESATKLGFKSSSNKRECSLFRKLQDNVKDQRDRRCSNIDL